MARTYTDDDRTHAVATYLEHGLAEAHHRTGIPRGTLRHWLTQAGHNPADIAAHATAKTRAAVHANAASMEARRVKLRAKLLTAAEHAVGQVVEADTGTDAKGWAVAGGIVIDKLRLELGEVTDRTEHRSTDAVTEEIQRLAAQMAEVPA